MTDDESSVRSALEMRSTEELVAILGRHDSGEWRPEVFGIVRSILISRGLFPQDMARMGREQQGEAARARPENASSTSEPGYLVASGMWFDWVEQVSEILGAAGIPVQLVEHRGFGFNCYVPQERAAIAVEMLQDAGLIQRQGDSGAAAISVAGGVCPGCGAEVRAGSTQCPECGLAV